MICSCSMRCCCSIDVKTVNFAAQFDCDLTDAVSTRVHLFAYAPIALCAVTLLLLLVLQPAPITCMSSSICNV
jgi:hypothetical protein